MAQLNERMIVHTENLTPAITATAGLIAPWLAETNGAPAPEALPAASIALHGAGIHFGNPRLDVLTAAPEIFNAIVVQGHPAVTELDVHAEMSERIFALKAQVEDNLGQPIAGRTTETLNHDSRIYDVQLNVSGLTDGEYQVRAWGEDSFQKETESKTTSFIVDNTPPTVELTASETNNVSGRVDLFGSVFDEYLSLYILEWRMDEDQSGTEFDWTGWSTLLTGGAPIPLRSLLKSVDSKALGWNGDVEIRLRAEDYSGFSASQTVSLTASNDVDAPAITIAGLPAELKDTVTFNVTLDDNPAYKNTGLKSAKVWIESASNAQTPPTVLWEKNDFNGTMLHTENSIAIESLELDRTYTNERWQVVVEVSDMAGNSRQEVSSPMTIGHTLWEFRVSPTSFRTGFNSSGNEGFSQVLASFTDSVDWTLTIQKPNRSWHRSWNGNSNSVNIVWYGKESDQSNSGYVDPGLYEAIMSYDENGQQKQKTVLLSVLPSASTYTAFPPMITRLESMVA